MAGEGRVKTKKLINESSAVIEEMLTYLKSKGYSVRGATYVNTIFLSDKAIAKALAKEKEAGAGGHH